MDKTAASIEAGIRSGCETMKRIIDATKYAIRSEENRLDAMRDRLEMLQSQPNPDETAI